LLGRYISLGDSKPRIFFFNAHTNSLLQGQDCG
jgi:hypothetical protein